MYRTDFWTLWEKARVGCFKRTALKHVYYLWWNRSPAQVGCMRQVLGPCALGRPRGIGWRRRWEGGPGWGTHVNPWLIHVSVWQNPLQYCKVISLQLIKINEKNKQTNRWMAKSKRRKNYLFSWEISRWRLDVYLSISLFNCISLSKLHIFLSSKQLYFLLSLFLFTFIQFAYSGE